MNIRSPWDLPPHRSIESLGYLMADRAAALRATEPLTPAQVHDHNLALLALGERVRELAVKHRPVRVVDALSAGATHAEVHEATRLTVPQWQAEVRTWATEQAQYGLMTQQRLAEVLALLGGEQS